jgi:glycosyltransferase involved in cell wall biosynthesis
MKDLKKFSTLKVYKALIYALEIIKKILTEKPDLAYFALSPFGYAFYRDAVYVFIFKLFRLKVLFHLHGKGIKQVTGNSLLRRIIYRMVFKNANVICLTNSLTKDIEKVTSSVPFIVPCGIPIHRKAKEKIFERKEVLQILYLSNYVKTKGILNLLDALNILMEAGYIFNARLVGAPTDLSVKDVEEYVRSKKLEKYVHVIGPKYGDEKYIEFLNADIFVFPTFYPNEAFPLVNLEAMQFGLPIISTNEGGIAEGVINNETGFIVDPTEVEQIADRIAKLIDDNDLRKSLGCKGKERFFEYYTLEHFIANIDKTFKTVISN